MSRRARRSSTVLAGIFVLALVAAGCSSSGSSASAPTTTRPATPTSGLPDAQTISAGEGQVIPGTATGQTPCEKAAPTPASPGEVGTGGGGSRARPT